MIQSLRCKDTEALLNDVNDQWRICFVWVKGDVTEVEIVDYH